MPDPRRTTLPAGRHEATPRRGAHERQATRPRHAAPSRPSSTPLLAVLAGSVVLVLGFSLVRGGALESARAIGLPVPPFFTPSITDRQGSDAPAGVSIDPETGLPVGSFLTDGSRTVTYTSTTTGEVVSVAVGTGPGQDGTTPAMTPWFPPVDDAGAPLPSSDTTSSPSQQPTQPVEIPPVPIIWTPEPTPTPSATDPAPETSAPDTPTPTFEPSSPGPGLTPTPTVDPTTPSADPTTPPPAPSTTSAPPPPPPSPTPPPTSNPPAPASALRFSPPALSNPTVMAYPEGAVSVVLDTGKDYILTLPRGRALVNTHGLTISGGRNVVIIGGAVDVRDGVNGARRGMYLANATPNGTVYVEGVRFLSSTAGSLTEGIDIGSPGAKVVLQNIAIDGTLSGSQATNHADAIQAWAGPEVLQIDGFSARTSYQGMFLLPTQHSTAAVGSWSLNRISLTSTSAGYLLWRDGSHSIRTSDVYVSGSQISNGGLWPNAGAWPDVTVGRAPEAYAATAGTTYSSPGYR